MLARSDSVNVTPAALVDRDPLTIWPFTDAAARAHGSWVRMLTY
jgi:hypothetical protein